MSISTVKKLLDWLRLSNIEIQPVYILTWAKNSAKSVFISRSVFFSRAAVEISIKECKRNWSEVGGTGPIDT